MSGAYIEIDPEMEKMFLDKVLNLVYIGKFKKDMFEYHIEGKYIVNPRALTQSSILKALDDGSLMQLN